MSRETWHIADRFGDTRVEIRDENGLLICDALDQDAPLIAAAPDLLEACKQLVKWNGKRGGSNDKLLPYAEQDNPEIRDAMSAIRKAEGER